MEQNPPVAEAKRLERADLNLLVRRDAVHRRHHREDRDAEEEYRQDGAHRFALLRFALHTRVGDMLFLGGDEQRRPRRRPKPVLQNGLFQPGEQMELRIVNRPEYAGQLLRRNVGEAEARKVGHQLIFVGDADHIFAALDQSYDGTADFQPEIGERQRVAEPYAVFVRETVGKPDAVAAFVVCGAGHDQRRGDGGVLRDLQRDRARRPLHGGGNAQETGRGVDAGNAADAAEVVLGEAGLGIQPVVGVFRFP